MLTAWYARRPFRRRISRGMGKYIPKFEAHTENILKTTFKYAPLKRIKHPGNRKIIHLCFSSVCVCTRVLNHEKFTLHLKGRVSHWVNKNTSFWFFHTMGAIRPPSSACTNYSKRQSLLNKTLTKSVQQFSDSATKCTSVTIIEPTITLFDHYTIVSTRCQPREKQQTKRCRRL